MNNIGELLRRRAWINGENEAIVDLTSGERLTYAALNARVNATAGMLRGLSVGKGDVVALLCMNGVEFVETYYACAKIGAVVLPLNWRLTPPELHYILSDSGSGTLVYGVEFTELVTPLRADLPPKLTQFIQIGGETADGATDYTSARNVADGAEPDILADNDDHLTYVYTSGTTGRPKGVVHSHRTAMAGILNVAATFRMEPEERHLIALPLFHVGASTPLLSHIYCGNTAILMREFNPAAMWDTFAAERVTSTLAVPAMLNFMLKVQDFEARDRSSLIGILSGASPVPVELINAYLDLGIEIHQVYGMTETFGPGCYLPGAEARNRLGAAGKGYLMTDIRLVDPDGNDVPPGTPGEILMRGAHNMVGYLNNTAATGETLVDGWLHSGDIGISDEDGYVTVHDRLKDMIISGGENVYPAEVENVLLAHEYVADVAVIGQPSADWGESPFAVVVPASDAASEAAIMSHCQGKLARFKQPKGMAFVEEIPRNPTGKPLKRLLRDKFPGST
ncbi:MAG: long-chain fatty acid--CoA ligase [Pseudomonadota bacterium]